MQKLNCVLSLKRAISLCAMVLILFVVLESQAQTPAKVTALQDNSGWKLQVNGQDFYVKGVVWGYTPIGENYGYNLWGHSDEYIKNVLDYECALMKKAGINTIRSFGNIPPKWVAYIYQQYGIMTMMNHLMGRYGYQVGGLWRPNTDYSDPLTRETLKKDITAWVQEYKDTPGVLMFALGNESNYGLEWSTSFEIENLPVGEQQKEKAKYLYSLFNEIIKEGKKIDQNHLFTIVNGDVQYLDLIKELCPELDMLGVNSYRGISFTDMWQTTKQNLGLPIVLTEFGSDAFNALQNAEDQAAQAHFLKVQWQEIYNKSYGQGEEGLAIGGCVFEWRDEWWKYKQTENLYVQDRHSSWSNGGYSFDYIEGQNNMNEEWFGICGLGQPNANGVFVATPRMAYDVLAAVWQIDPYKEEKATLNSKINGIDMRFYAVESDVRLLKNEQKKRDFFSLTGGSLRGEMVTKGIDSAIREKGENGVEFSNGEMIFMDFGFQPSDKLQGNFTLNLLGNVPDKDIENIFYGMRGLPLIVQTKEVNDSALVSKSDALKDRERLEIYSFQATYQAKYADFTTFYHVPRYHWGYEGDFFGLMREATDMQGMDIWNAKAPFGWEFVGKQSLDGLKVVIGPEIYWGANPKAMIKYNFGKGRFKYTLIHAEDIARKNDPTTATSATERQTRQTTFNVKTDFIPKTTLEVGVIMAGTEKVDEAFNYQDGDDIVYDKIEYSDTFGAKALLTLDAVNRARIYAGFQYAGLVADGGAALKEFGTELPYSDYGNKIEYEGGVLLNFNELTIYPRMLSRKNLLDANPIIEPSTDGTTLHPGLNPRNRDDDPFAVLDNREALSGEIFATYDPTPATSFYAWDSDKREDAGLAFNIGANMTRYDTDTDAYLFFYKEGKINASFGKGLPKEDVWKAKSRIIMNPNPNLRLIADLVAGYQQSTGTPEGDTRRYYELRALMNIANKHRLAGYVKKNSWGPYDYFRQFNVTYPYQYMLDYSIRMDNFATERLSSAIGLKGFYRTLDENSQGSEYDGGKNNYMFEVSAYYNIEF